VVSMLGAAVAAREGRLLSLSSVDALLSGKSAVLARFFTRTVAVIVAALLFLASAEFVLAERAGGNVIVYGIPAAQATAGRKAESLKPGRADQIVLRHAAKDFPSFEVRNVAANGIVWTGKGNATLSIFPPLDTIAADDRPSENMCSLGLRIRYGRFDYFTGGDMPGVPDAGAPEWQSVEKAVARAIGPTDVHVVNHHGSIDPASAFFLGTLQSPVMILPAWSATHPSQDSLKRMLTKRLYPGPHDVFVTTLREPTKASIGSRTDQLKAQHGHIVVRVEPGGEKYRVFVLDDTTSEATVLSVHGPYLSR